MDRMTQDLEMELASLDRVPSTDADAGAAGYPTHLLHSNVIAAAAKASADVGAAVHGHADGEEEEEESEDVEGNQLTHHEGLLKASILEKVASEKRLRRLSEVFVDDEETEESVTDTGDLFETLPEPYGQLSTYQRIQITSAPDEVDRETKEVCELIRKCVALRHKWLAVNEPDLSPSPSAETPASPRAGAGGATRLRHRDEIPYEPFANPVPATTQHRLEMVDG
ncbi:hypothetical protein BBJ28_00026618, partial [Nothophytophthora sp. Chile5]